MKERISKDTIAYCITAIICSIILGLFYMKTNRYVPLAPGIIIDRQKGSVIEDKGFAFGWEESNFKHEIKEKENKEEK